MNTELTIIDLGIIAEINSEHALALSAYETAKDHAFRAGELLLQVKESLPHGAFGAWLSENVTVSERQAQRYMRQAKGLPLLRSNSKSDTVSFLECHDDETIAEIVANAVAQQIAVERAKMIADFEREKELVELATSINEDFAEFKQNRDGLIGELFEMKKLHAGAYWTQLVDLHANESMAAAIFDDFSRESMDAIEWDEKSAVVIEDCLHANFVAVIDLMKQMRDSKGYAALGYETFEAYAQKMHPETDLEHLERYQQMPIYSEIVESVKAFKVFESVEV